MTALRNPAAPLPCEPCADVAPRSCGLGLAVGAAVLLGLGAAEPVSPLPAAPWAAAFLFCVAWQDVWKRRIPNLLTFPALLGALLLALLGAGVPGACWALASALLAIAVLFVPFAFRGMGGGDLKAAAVLFALWGAAAGLSALGWAITWAGLFAAALLLARGELGELGRRWLHSLGLSLALRRPVYLPPPPRSAASAGLPFGVALGAGAVTHAFFGEFWRIL